MDKRTEFQKKIDDVLGPPLYYCSDCRLAVKVTVTETEPVIERPCKQDCGHEIIAPRKAVAAGEGGLNMKDRVKVAYWQIASALTGRCV